MTQSIESIIEVLQAYKDGKKIDYRNVGFTQWSATDDPQWQFRGCEYRIAPEPKKKVKLEAWLSPTGQLMWWLDTSKVDTWSTDWIRVPSEDKEMTLDPRGGYCNYQAVEILRQRVAELEKERDEIAVEARRKQRSWMSMCKERDEWEANSGQWEQEYYKVCKERDALTAEVNRQKHCIRGLTDQCAALVVEKNSLLMDHGGALCDRAKIEMLEVLLAGDGALITGLKDDIAQLTAERDALKQQRDKLVAAAEAVEIDAEECLDFDECTAMLVPIDTYRKLIEAIARINEK